MFRQAVAVRQWRWKGSDAWRGAGTARRSGTVSPGGVWAEPGGNVVVLAFWVHGWWRTCDDMSGEVHIQLLSRGDTSEVHSAGLRAGRLVEAGPRASSSLFLFVCGNDHVIRYTGADVDIGGAEDVQMAE
ncbi:hypothetical protein DEO72_LG6g1451 [Vigna unguiculata]|uniref:Uncharacterized protein n=1 Tax=Vigna unguiculata TaxID=3917 RepID=A0A4D6M613_VIGUN|nr:hypothetical protein DEO72_LG6g1451 [Vigna unguiculata]